ncbi:MAG: hypothetical protein WC718_16415 [Phycisphaerales bacterium]|jgi:hypothetical protein
MPEPRHFLEQVSDLLAERLKEEVEAKFDALRGPNGRPLFSEKRDIRWWQVHRYDSIGQKALDMMDTGDVLELDQALSIANEQARLGGGYGGSEPQDF